MKSAICILSLLSALISTTVFAQTGVITQIRDNRAVVEFDATELLKIGDKLVLQNGNLLNVQMVATTPAAPQAQLSVPPTPLEANTESLSISKPELRKREHNITWKYDSTSSKEKVTNNSVVTADVTVDTTEIELSYLKNLGFFEFGGFIATYRKDIDGDKTTTSEIGGIAHLNFVKNEPGNDIVPYVYGKISGAAIEFSSPTTTTVSADGTGVYGGLGLLYYPFSELFAVDATLGIARYRGVVDDTQVEIDIKQSNFNIGWRLSF